MREDHLKRQIDLLARALGKVLFGLLGVKTGPVLSLEEITEVARTEGGLDEDVFSLDEAKLIALFRSDRRWNGENISALAEIHFEMGSSEQETGMDVRTWHLRRALFIFEYQNKATLTYSEDREEKIQWLKNTLKNMIHE